MTTYSVDTYTGDGSTVDFSVTFKFIQRSHVEVYRVDTASKVETKLTFTTNASPTGDEYVWVTDQLITVGTAPTAAQELKIKRDTPEDIQLVQWADGSYIVAADLNESDKQWLFNLQEQQDQVSEISSSLPSSYVTKLVAGANITLNPVDGTGAVTITGEEAGVTQLIAGSNVTLTPADGKGVVTIASTGGGGGGPVNTDGLPEGSVNLYYTDARVESYVNGAGYVKGPVVTKLVAGNNIVLSPSNGEGIVTITSISGAAMTYMGLIDATGAAPAGPRNGDLYVNTASSGTVDASWTGLGGEVLTGNERLVYASDTSTWGMIRDFGVPEAPADGSLYARKNQSWEAFTIPLTYWTLSGSDLYPVDPSYNFGLGGSSSAPNIVLTAAGAGTFAGDVTAANVTATADITAANVTATTNVTATGTVEGASVVATGGGFSGTALQVSGSVSAGSYRIDLLPTLP